IAPHDRLAMVLNPGHYEVVLNRGLAYSTTHEADGSRTTGNAMPSAADQRPVVHLHGCSYTYGYGVSDSASFPYRLQQAIPGLRIENRAVPGYGQVQPLLLLREMAANGTLPDAVVLVYNHFHKDRNALNGRFRRQFYFGRSQQEESGYLNERPTSWHYPYATWQQDSLAIHQADCWDIYTPLWGSRSSALINLAESARVIGSIQRDRETLLTQQLVKAMDRLCRAHGTRFTVALMSGKEDLQAFCDREGIAFVDLYVDLNQPGYRNVPYDYHPSPHAQRELANRLLPFFLEFLEAQQPPT
ncbi:MAG: hypothetical protein AAGB22_07795, partial [Bacteroidota bacterium]